MMKVGETNRTNKRDLIQEITRHAEAKLSAQVQLAVSADQRATVLGGIYVAASTGVLGAVATNDFAKTHLSVIVGGVITAICFLIAASYCIKATLPIDFHLPGNEPRNWESDLANNRSVQQAIAEQATHFDAAIKKNNDSLKENADLFGRGARLGMWAPVIGAMFGLIILAVASEQTDKTKVTDKSKGAIMAPNPSEPTKKDGSRDFPKPQPSAPRPNPAPAKPK